MPTNHRNHQSWCLVCACLMLAWGGTAETRAQSVWNGGTGNWSVAADWLPAVTHVSGATTALTFGGSTGYTATDDITGTFQFNSLLFNNTAGTATLAGNALNVVNPLNGNTVLPTIALTGAGSATVSAAMTWSGETTVTNSGSGTLLFNGSQTFNNGIKQTVTNSGTGTITFADAIAYSNSGGANGGLVLNLINNNSTAGSFNVGNLGALGNGTNFFYLNVGGTGTVKFSGSTSGDLFGNNAILTVQSGATFDFNGNGETMGGIAGAGTIAMTAAASITTTLAGYYVFSGKLTGTGALVVNAASDTLVLSGSTSTYTGTTSVQGGTIIVSANAPSGSAGAFGNATTSVLVGYTSGAVSATLMMDTAGVTIGRNIQLQSGNTGTATLGGLNSSGTVTYGGSITLGAASAAAKGLTVFSTSGGTVLFTGSLLRAASATGSTDTLTLTGSGTVVLQGSGDTFTGTTTVSGGTLVLDHTVSNNAKLSSTAALTLNGGSLSLSGSSTAASTETVSSLTLGNSTAPLAGGAQIKVTSGTNQNATLTLGAITRNTGATVDFSSVNNGTGVASITTTTANTASGILGAYATYQLNDWAVNDGTGNITALAAGSYTTSFGSGLATSLSASTALASGGATTNTLRFTGAAALTFNTTTPGTLTLETGGILVATTAGATSIGTTTTRGTLTSTTGEVIINQQSSSALTINSVINGGTLTVSGAGNVNLTATNTVTSNIVINNGATVTVTANGNLGAATTAITLNGGTLAQTGAGTLTFASSTGHSIFIGPAGGTLSFAAVQGIPGATLSGSGNLTVTGGGGFTTGTSSSTFTGNIFITNAGIYSNSSQLTSAASVTVASGATWGVEDDAVGTFNIATGGRIMLNGNGLGGNGALRLTDQSTGTALLDPRTTIGNDIVLQTDSLVQVDNSSYTGVASVAGSLSVLTLTGNISGPGALSKSGQGNLIIAGANNTYTGNTNVQSGMLILNLGNDRLPTGTSVTLGSGSSSGILELNGFSQTIAGLSTSGTGTADSVLGGSSATTSLLSVNTTSGTQTFSGTLGGVSTNNTGANNNLGLIKNGAGTFVLSGANTYTGGTIVAQGTLALGNAGALGNSGATLATSAAGTVVSSGATLDLNGQSNVQGVITLNGLGLSNGGALVNNSGTAASIGSGIASLSIPTATTAGWAVGATVSLGAPTAGTTATATALLGLTSSSFNLTAVGSGYVLAPVITVSGGGGTGAVVTASMGVTTASYTITSGTTTYSVAPTVTLSNGATATANLDGTGKVISITVLTPGSAFSGTPGITFSGGTTIATGVNPTGAGNNTHYTVVGLNVINAGTGYTSLPTVSITGGTGATATVVDGNFALNGIALTGSGSGYTSAPSVTVSGGTATATANVTSVALASDSSIGGSGSLTVNAVISGGYGLTKVGTGTTTFTAANSYTGATVVSGGTLQVGASGTGQTGTGAVSVQSGAVLDGTGYVAGSSFTAASGSTVQAGDSTAQSSYGTLHFTPATGSGSVTFQAGSTIVLGINPGGTSDMLQITGNGSTSLSFNGNLTVTASAFTPTAPATFHLLDWTGLTGAPTFDSRYTYTGLVYGNGDTPAGLVLPDISASGFAWDLSAFTSAGNLSIVAAAVPEPSRALLLGLSLLLLVARRRR